MLTKGDLFGYPMILFFIFLKGLFSHKGNGAVFFLILNNLMVHLRGPIKAFYPTYAM